MFKQFFMTLIGSIIGISAWAQVTHYYTSPDSDYKLHYQILSDNTAGITKWEVLDASKAHLTLRQTQKKHPQALSCDDGVHTSHA